MFRWCLTEMVIKLGLLSYHVKLPSHYIVSKHPGNTGNLVLGFRYSPSSQFNILAYQLINYDIKYNR